MKKTLMSTVVRADRKRGAVLIIFALGLFAIMGLAALAIDLGAVFSAKAQLQAGADAAALAGVQELDSGAAPATAAQFASLNSVLKKPITLDQSDVVTGWVDFSTGVFTPDGQPINAVKVTTRRTPDSPDGPVELFFGRAIGIDCVSVEAESVAAIDGRVNGVEPAATEKQYDLLPFAVKLGDVGHLETIEAAPIGLVDFDVDPATGTVTVHELVDLSVQVLGSQITCGLAGPTIPVYWQVSVDNGSTYDEINAGQPVTGGEEAVYPSVADLQLAINARAVYTVDGVTYFDTTRYSNAGTPYVVVLGQGDTVPEYKGIDGQDEIAEFLAPYMDPTTRQLTVGPNDLVFLFEFASDLNSAAADFQDLVVISTFTKLENEGLARSDTRFVANEGQTIDFYPYVDIEAPGNFGLVSLDGYSNGASVLSDWIRNGYPGSFTIPADPGYIEMNGCPGETTSIGAAVESRIGDTVLVTVYDTVTGQGDNACYRVPYFLAVEIVDVHLVGEPNSRHIRGTIKGLTTSNLITQPGAPEHAALGKSRMVR